MLADRFADLRNVAERGDDVDASIRVSGALDKFGKCQCEQSRCTGRLDDARTACCERWRDLACRHGLRQVPWQQARHYTDWLSNRVRAHVRIGSSNCLALRTHFRHIRKPGQEAGCVLDFCHGFSACLAVLAHNQRRHVVYVAKRELVESAKHLAALPRRGLRELLEGREARVNGIIHILGVAFRDRGDHHFAVARVDNVELFARKRVDSVRANHDLGVEQRAVFEPRRFRRVAVR